MEAPIIAALIALVGVLAGLLGRDVVMALLIAHQKRQQEVTDRKTEHARARRDLVRIYADPLKQAAESLRFRLDEVVSAGQARYLRANSPRIPYLEYKRISTIYRLAALLGWVRAFRRERSHLDPEEVVTFQADNDPIGMIERALADGQHVENQRLDELLSLWKVPKNTSIDSKSRSRLATAIDGVRQDFVSRKGSLSASDLEEQERIQLSRDCSRLISDALEVDIPTDFVDACATQASTFLGIKEAYIYRDWQAAIGDLMIHEVANGPRRFDVIGFGSFEDRYLKAHEKKGDSLDRRWISRLEALFHDLDMSKAGMFDARRQQLLNLHDACKVLENQLKSKLSGLQDPN